MASRSGMFCAIATTIERCKTEGVVDVFQVVKALRIQKPAAVRTVVSHITPHPVAGLVCATRSLLLSQVQYQTIYVAVLVFLDSFEAYANFQK